MDHALGIHAGLEGGQVRLKFPEDFVGFRWNDLLSAKASSCQSRCGYTRADRLADASGPALGMR